MACWQEDRSQVQVSCHDVSKATALLIITCLFCFVAGDKNLLRRRSRMPRNKLKHKMTGAEQMGIRLIFLLLIVVVTK